VQQALASAPVKQQAAFRAVAVLAGSTPMAPSVVPCDEVSNRGDHRSASRTLPSGAWLVPPSVPDRKIAALVI
jgi:hypothetical protein